MKCLFKTSGRIHGLISSVPSHPLFRQEIVIPKTKRVIRYYVLLTLLLTVVNSTIGIVRYASTVRNYLTESANEVVQNFPPDLELTISPNGVTANKDFPLIAQTPKVLTGLSAQEGLPENLLVIDPKGEIGMLQKYNALMLINNSYVIVGDGDSVQTTPLKDFPEVQVSYSKMRELSQSLLFVANNALLFTAGFFIISNLFDFFVLQLLYLVVFASILRLVYKNVLANYSQSFSMSMCGISLPLLISTTLEVAQVKAPLSGWFVFVHTLFTFYLLRRLEKPTTQAG